MHITAGYKGHRDQCQLMLTSSVMKYKHIISPILV